MRKRVEHRRTYHRVIFYNYTPFYEADPILLASRSHAFPPLRYCFLLKARFHVIFQEAECSRNVCRMFRARLESTIDASSIYVSSVTALILNVVNYHFAREREEKRDREEWKREGAGGAATDRNRNTSNDSNNFAGDEAGAIKDDGTIRLSTPRN